MAYKNKEDQAKYRANWLKSENRPKATCHPEKPHAARGMCSSCYDLWLYKNSEKNRATKSKNAKLWKAANPEKAKKGINNARLIRRYGINQEQYDQMFDEQKGVCKICSKPTRIKLHVDHCHVSGKVRGLLCLRCNGSLAWVEQVISKQKTEWFSNALKYLEDGK